MPCLLLSSRAIEWSVSACTYWEIDEYATIDKETRSVQMESECPKPCESTSIHCTLPLFLIKTVLVGSMGAHRALCEKLAVFHHR